MTDPDKVFFRGMTIRQFMEIVKLASCRYYNWDTYELGRLTFGVRQERPSPYNDFQKGGQYIYVDMPLVDKEGKYGLFGFVVRLYDDGYLLFENGSDCHIRTAHPMECAKLIEQYLKPKKAK